MLLSTPLLLLSAPIHDFSADFKAELIDTGGKATLSQDCKYIFNRDLKIMGASRDKSGPYSLILGAVSEGRPPFGKIKPGLALKYWVEPLIDFDQLKKSVDEKIKNFAGEDVLCEVFKGEKVGYWKEPNGHLIKAEIIEERRHWRFTFGNHKVNSGAGQKLADIFKKQEEEKKSFIGSKAPEAEALTLDGRKVKPSDYLGQVVALEFFAYGWGPCRSGLPGLQLLAHKFPEAKFIIVCLDSKPDKLVKLMKTKDIKLTVFHDKFRQFGKNYRIEGIPDIVLLDKKGIVRWRGHPAEPQFKAKLEELSGR